VAHSRVLGVFFEKNCPDIRNYRLVGVVRKLAEINPCGLVSDHGAIYDVKSVWPKEMVDKRL
jgi:UDP-N-acetyl-D-mannosaminuronate dehydrogenase